MTGRINVDRSKFFEMQLSINTHDHSLKIFKQHARTFVKRWSFSSKTVNGMLPSHVVEATNVQKRIGQTLVIMPIRM